MTVYKYKFVHTPVLACAVGTEMETVRSTNRCVMMRDVPITSARVLYVRDLIP